MAQGFGLELLKKSWEGNEPCQTCIKSLPVLEGDCMQKLEAPAWLDIIVLGGKRCM